ncbi:MAG: hypothetical protein ABIO53_07570 [Chitinophagaceae bacterium]
MKKTQAVKELETILVLVLAAVVLYWQTKKPFFLLFALILGLAGLLIPIAAKSINWVWMKIAELVGFVMNRIILAIIFIFIVMPLGWLSRKLGKSSVKLKPGGKSYFIERNHQWLKEDMENPW